jgi:hypothetical protein
MKFSPDNKKLVVSFVDRLCRQEITPASAEWIAEQALDSFLLEYDEDLRQFMPVALIATLRSLPFDELLLNQDEHPDLKLFIQIVRTELSALGYRIS